MGDADHAVRDVLGSERLDMRDRSGASRKGVRCRALLRRGHARHVRADADVVRRAAARLRADPGHIRTAGLAGDEDITALAALLDVLAAALPHLDPAIRRDVVASCRAVLEEE
jgi:hypothetical protein